MINVHFICQQQSDRIVPVTPVAAVRNEKGFRSRLLIPSGDIDSAGVSIASDQENLDVRSNDDSITNSEDSDATRIYNLNTRETKIVPPNRQKQQLRAKIAMMESPLESPVEVTHQTQFFDDQPENTETKQNNEHEHENDKIQHDVNSGNNNGHRELRELVSTNHERIRNVR